MFGIHNITHTYIYKTHLHNAESNTNYQWITRKHSVFLNATDSQRKIQWKSIIISHRKRWCSSTEQISSSNILHRKYEKTKAHSNSRKRQTGSHQSSPIVSFPKWLFESYFYVDGHYNWSWIASYSLSHARLMHKEIVSFYICLGNGVE